ncbi:hypothetical protein OQA88_8159 [Cercophora sp. LCS_1]
MEHLRPRFRHVHHHGLPQRRDSTFSDATITTLSSGDDDEGSILDAVRRAKAFKLCLRRIWAVSANLPNRARSLPNLIPAAGTFSVPSHSRQHHEHEQCTFDFCEHSRIDFTSVAQRHECQDPPGPDCGNYVFPLQQLSSRVDRSSSTAWELVSGSPDDVPSLLDPTKPYMAVSHVWADGTGAGIWGPGKVNKCLYEFFCKIARDFQCEGCWWDAVSIPQEAKARSKALAGMQNNYADARITLVHDLYLREWEWVDAATACFAIVMSPWYSRGWTALELAKSHKVKILFKARNEHHVIKDLDIDILDQVPPDSPYLPAAKAISKLRSAKVQNLGDLLSILAPRDTSKPRDVPIISGLLAGVDVSGVLSQQEVYQRILRKLGKVAQGHLFHSSATMAAPGFSWCPTNILDMPMANMEPGSVLLSLQENGDLEGSWKMCPVDSIPNEDLIWHSVHDLTHVALKVALNDKNKAKHILLVETPCPKHRALLVQPMAFDDDVSGMIRCKYVGPVYFKARSMPGGETPQGIFDEGVVAKVKICNNEKMLEIDGDAWGYVNGIVGRHDETSGEPNLKLAGRTLSMELDSMDLLNDEGEVKSQDLKALLFLAGGVDARRVYSSLFESESATHLQKPGARKTSDDMVMFFRFGEGGNVEVYFYGHVDIVEKVRGWLPKAKVEHGRMMMLHVDQSGQIAFNSGQGLDTALGPKALRVLAGMKGEGLGTLVTLLLDNGAQHRPDKSGQWPIHWAVINNNFDVVRSILTKKVNAVGVRQSNEGGRMAIHLAAEHDHTEIAELLIEHGGPESLNERDKEGQTALIVAAICGASGITRLLVCRGADTDVSDLTRVGQTALHYAAAKGHLECVSALLGQANIGPRSNKDESDEGAGGDDKPPDDSDDANKTTVTRANVDSLNREHMTALHLASMGGYSDVVQMLLAHKANSSAVDSKGRTALMLAVTHGDLRTVEKLLEVQDSASDQGKKRLDIALLSAVQNLDVKVKESEGYRMGCSVVRKLLEVGAMSGYSDPSDGMTALHWAVKTKATDGEEFVADLLIGGMAQADPRLNYKEKKGEQSALIMAVANKWGDFALKLMEKGADVKVKDSRRRTVLHWAAVTQDVQIVDKILGEKELFDVLIDEKDAQKRTALHLAAQSETVEAVITAALLGARANADSLDVYKRTALMSAAAMGRVDAVKELVTKSDPDLTAEDISKKTALDLAAEKGYEKVVIELLHGKSLAMTDATRSRALELSAQAGHLQVSMAIYDKINGIKFRESAIPTLLLSAATAATTPNWVVDKVMEEVTDPNPRDESGQTALMLAVHHRKYYLFRSLLDHSANPDLVDHRERTALMIAVEKQALDFVEMLLRSNANPNLRDKQGYTAMHFSVESGLLSLVTAFLRRNLRTSKFEVDLNAVDNHDRSLVHLAIDKLQLRREGSEPPDLMGGFGLIWQYLLFYGASPNTQDDEGQTPLHRAVRRNRIDAVPSIVDSMQRRAKDDGKGLVNAKDKKGRTVLHLAAERGFWEVVVGLVSMNIFDLNAQDNLDQTPLLLAAEGGDDNAVSSLLSNKAKPNLSDKRSRTPLLEAARNGHKDMVDLLLRPRRAEPGEEHGRDDREKANVDARDDMGQTALMVAAENGYEDVVESLLKNHADAGLVDNEKKKAWQRAMEKGHSNVVNTLLSRQGAPGQDQAGVNDALLLASGKGWTELAEVLLNQDADVTFQSPKWQSTALHLAAMSGHVQVIKKLLAKGVDVATKDAEGRTALMRATEHGFESVVQVLLEQSEAYIKRDVGDCMGPEALHCAAEKGFVGIVKELLKTDVAVDARDAVERTALALAAMNGSREIVAMLLENEASSVVKDVQGRTPLHYAAWGGHKDVVECLLDNKAEVNVLDSSSQTPLHLAAERASHKVVELLLNRGANTHARSRDGQTALHRAAWGGSHKAVEILRERGADASTRDNRNNKAWQVAAEKGHESIAETLLRVEESVENDLIKGKKVLIFASERGYTAMARALLGKRADTAATDPGGRTPLHLAAMQGDYPMVDLLVNSPASRKTLDVQDHNQCTPLCLAVMNDRVMVARLLVEKGANLNTRRENGQTVLHIAAQKGFGEIVRILQERGADLHTRDENFKQKAWFLAADAGHYQIARSLLEREVDFNPQSQKIEELFLRMADRGFVHIAKLLHDKGVNKDAADQLGRTALGRAAENGKAEVVKYLLDAGADPSVTDSSLQTPLHWAAEKGNLMIVNLLLDSITAPKSSLQPPLSSSDESESPSTPVSPVNTVSADMLNQTDSQGRTALLLAIHHNKDETVRLLLKKGARRGMDLDKKDGKGRAALHLAVEAGKEKLVEELVEARASQEAVDTLGRTPLFLAVQHGHEKIVDALLQDVPLEVVRERSDKHGRSALHVAAEQGHLSILKKLLKRRFEIDKQESLGRTPLLLAADNGDKAVVDLLLSHEARQDLGDSAGRTPLSLAVANGDFPIVEALLNRPDAAINSKNSPLLLRLAVKSRSKQVAWLVADHLTHMQGVEQQPETAQTENLTLSLSEIVTVELTPDVPTTTEVVPK